MLKPRWILLLLALTMVGAVGFVLHAHTGRTPESLHESAKRRLSGDLPDFDGALRDLDLALDMALSEGDEELAGRIYSTRANTYSWKTALPEARRDFQHLLEVYRPGDRSLILKLARIDFQLGDYDSAIENVERVLAHEPSNPEALNLRGRSRYRLAEQGIEGIALLLNDALADEPAEAGIALVWHAAAMSPADPHRTATLSDLQVLVGDPKLFRTIHGALDEISTRLADARGSFAAGLERWPNPDSIHGLLRILEHGGHDQEIVDIGLAAIVHGGVRSDMRSIEILTATLRRLGRDRDAVAVLEDARGANLRIPDDFLPRWCELLYANEEWARLERIAETMRRRAWSEAAAEQRASAHFYLGISKMQLDKVDQAARELRVFTRAPPVEPPVENAMAIALLTLARAARRIDRPDEEYLALQRLVRIAPDFDGRAWTRLSQLQLTNREPLPVAVASATHAVELQPREIERLMPMWVDLSRRALAERGLSIQLVREEVNRMGRSIPAREALAFELWGLAEIYVEEGNWWRAERALERLLADHPLFTPALDLLIDVEMALGAHSEALDLLLDRLAHAGPHPETLAILARISKDSLGPERFLELMRRDPLNTGLATVAEELRRRGRAPAALRALTAFRPERLQTETRLLAAELQGELGRWLDAYRYAASSSPADEPDWPSLELRLRAALELSDEARDLLLRPTLPWIEASIERDPARAAAAAEALAAHGELDHALGLLQILDASETSRSSDVLLGLAATRLGLGEHRAAEEALDRAEPFLIDGRPELGRILLHADEGSFGWLPSDVAGLRASELRPSRLEQAILLCLEERVEEAAAMAVEQLDGEDGDPRWFVVLAAANALLPGAERLDPPVPETYAEETWRFVGADGTRDPRLALALLLALGREPWSAWGMARLGAAGADAGEVWPPYLRARTLRRLDRPAAARRELLALVEGRPAFAPAWRMLEALELERLRNRLHPDYLDLLERRVASPVPPDDPALHALTQARRLEREGDAPGAIALLEDALAEPPPTPELLLALADLHLRAGRTVPGIRTLARLFESTEAELAFEHVPRFLGLCEEAFSAERISERFWRVQLETLRIRYPDDPAVVLASARHGLLTSSGLKAEVLGRTLRDLASFRKDHARSSIEALRPGQARAWFDLYMEHDAVRAEGFAREELLTTPGHVDLWLMLAEALEAQGRLEEALEQDMAVVAITNDPRGLRHAARILADLGSEPEVIDLAIERIRKAEGSDLPDPTLAHLRARALVRFDGPSRDRGIGILKLLWDSRGLLARLLSTQEVGRHLAATLLRRAGEGDGAAALEVLSEILPATEDPVENDVLVALSHLARWVPRVGAEASGG